MPQNNLSAVVRTARGGSYRRALAARGMAPAVVYGKNIGSLPVEVDIRKFYEAMTGGRNTIIDLNINGDKTYSVMVKEVQRDPIRQDIMHIDFHQISLEDKIQVAVPLIFEGEVSPGGVLQIVKRELNVSCLPTDIPEEIKVNVDGLSPGDSIAVSSLAVPGEVTILDELDATVVTVTVVAEEPAGEADEAEAEGEGAAGGEGEKQ